MPEAMALGQTACGVLKDKRRGEKIVVIGCAADTNNVLLWNTADNTIKASGWVCPPADSPPAMAEFDEVDDNWLAFSMQAQGPGLWLFNLVNGFSFVTSYNNRYPTCEAHGNGGMAVVPPDYVQCSSDCGP